MKQNPLLLKFGEKQSSSINKEFPSCVVCLEDQILCELSIDHPALYSSLQCHYYGSLYCWQLSWPTLKMSSKRPCPANTPPALPTLSQLGLSPISKSLGEKSTKGTQELRIFGASAVSASEASDLGTSIPSPVSVAGFHQLLIPAKVLVDKLKQCVSDSFPPAYP